MAALSSTANLPLGDPEFTSYLLPREQASAAFRPLTPAPAGPRAPASSPLASHAAEPVKPRVELVREGDRVTRIRITCTCGQTVELECTH